ncbi:MAG: histidine ammonia-lyase [Gammaproteobacteria bacterium]|nr:histidine ammonia-lyase [Gammaproteobacteria bacterium]
MIRTPIIPGRVPLHLLESVYRSARPVRLDRHCRPVVDAAAGIVSAAARKDTAIYGINTGFGKLSSTRIAPGQTVQLQRNLVLSHCCGVGPDLPDEIVRLIMLVKLSSLGQGASGVRWELIELMQAMLNNGILPVIPAKGSVGASGDLAPLAHLTAAMIGEGQVRFQGRVLDAADALRQNNLEPWVLGPKEGLAMINGTQVSTALALAALFDTWRSCQTALIAGALSSDALMASTVPFQGEIHRLRKHRGQMDAARSLRSLLEGSAIRDSHREGDERVQDPYCIRCQPQVMGACMDQLRQVAATLEIEANSVTDNPLVMVETGRIMSGGNFHAEPVAFAADQNALAIAEMGAIAERRIATLVDPALNHGLPPFLSPDPGLSSGFMGVEITAAALMSENKHKAAPCSVDSTPTSANQEDHVSMACHGAWRLMEMNQNLAHLIAIELLAATQGAEFRRPVKTSAALQRVMDRVREVVDRLDHDRYIGGEIARATDLVRTGALVTAVGDGMVPALHHHLPENPDCRP